MSDIESLDLAHIMIVLKLIDCFCVSEKVKHAYHNHLRIGDTTLRKNTLMDLLI